MASTGDTWRLGRRPALDGLRGVAILLVLISHSVPWWLYFGGGSAGVTMFFVLSGFLITSLLLEERADSGRVNFGRFYARRARRLLPALFLYVAVIVGIGAATPREALPTLLYYGNIPSMQGHATPVLAHTWSLAIEEQFYLLWPLLLILAMRWLSKREVLLLTVILAAASMAERLVLWQGLESGSRVYNGLDTRGDALLIGCAIALWLHGRAATVARPRPIALGVSLVVVALVGIGSAPSTPFSYLFVPTVAALATAVTLLLVLQGHYVGWLTWRPLAYIGRRSYGFYLWHVPLVQGYRIWHGLPGWTVLPLLAVAWAVTELSWRYVERPIQQGSLSGFRRAARPAVAVSKPVTLVAEDAA